MFNLILFGILNYSFFMNNTSENNDTFYKISTQNKNIINSNSFMDIEGSLTYDISTDSQFEKCEFAIYGEITKTEYLVYNNTPWTKLEIKCQKVFKGDLNKNNILSVYVMGGYLDKDSFEEKFGKLDNSIDKDTLIEIDYFQKELSNVDDEGFFYLVSNDESTIFKNNTYSFLCSGYSKMMYDKKSDNIELNINDGIKEIPKSSYISKLNSLKK